MSEPLVPRRTFLHAGAGAAAVGAAAAFGVPGAAGAAPAAPGASPGDAGVVRLGVASYSLRTMPRDRTIAAVRALGTR